MLYSIIPPVLIVLSLIGIIVLIMSKVPLVKKFRQQENDQKNDTSDFKKRQLSPVLKTGSHLTAAMGKISDMKIKEKFLNPLNNLRSRLKKSEPEKNLESEKSQNVKIQEPGVFFKRRNTSAGKDNAQIIGRDEVYEIPRQVGNEKESLSDVAGKKDIFEKILIERIAANPKDIEAYERLGEYYLEIESWEDAKECFKQVIKLNPRNLNVKNKMRKLERLLGK